jgi:hypothetical protein
VCADVLETLVDLRELIVEVIAVRVLIDSRVSRVRRVSGVSRVSRDSRDSRDSRVSRFSRGR